jgi:hypothetical protein
VLDELRNGAIHLTGLFLLSQHLTEGNADALLDEARYRSKRELERLIARWFPRPDAPERIVPAPSGRALDASADVTAAALPIDVEASGSQGTCPGQGSLPSHGRLEPLSLTRYRVEFTASAELHDKIERARELLSHSVPSGELSSVLERALDALIQRETTRRLGAGRPRKPRATRNGSRHVPVTVSRRVWKRDGAQCTFHDAEGRRCSERRFLTIDHRQPFALGGPPTVENLCLLCSAHNQHTARHVFGQGAVRSRTGNREAVRAHHSENDAAAERRDDDAQRAPEPCEREQRDKVLSALCNLGFRRPQAARAVEAAKARSIGPGLEPLLRAALEVLTA